MDYIILEGVDYPAFGFTHADEPGWPVESVESGVLRSGSAGAGKLQFNPDAGSFSFILNRDRNLSLSIYRPSGDLVKNLFTGPMSFGSHSISWNWSDNQGTKVKKVVYICRLKSGAIEQSVQAVIK